MALFQVLLFLLNATSQPPTKALARHSVVTYHLYVEVDPEEGLPGQRNRGRGFLRSFCPLLLVVSHSLH